MAEQRYSSSTIFRPEDLDEGNADERVESDFGRAIEAQKEDFAKRIVDEQSTRNPAFQVRYGALGHAKCVQDVKYNLGYLAEAIPGGEPGALCGLRGLDQGLV